MTESDDPRWTELLEDAAVIAEEYRDDGWDAVVLEPEAVVPVERDSRTGFDVRVSSEAFDLVESLVETGDVTVTAADVYYRPPDDDTDRRVALVVERDEETETAVFVPLAYDLAASRPVFEAALEAERLQVHVTPTPENEAIDADGWVSFSHDDPSLFLEEADVRGWFDGE